MHTKKSKRVTEYTSPKKYSGEKSPYRTYINRKGRLNQDGDRMESNEANADNLPEEAGLWWVTEATDEQKALVATIMSHLTPRQKEILSLVGFEGKTFDHTAVILGIKRSTVQKTIERIRIKFASLNEA